MKLFNTPPPLVIGSSEADQKAHQAFVSVTERIARARREEKDKPRGLGTKLPSVAPPDFADEDVHFDYELTDPLTAVGWVAGAFVAFNALLVITVILFA